MAAVFDAGFRPLGRKRRKTKGNEGTKAGIDRIVETIHDACQESSIVPEQLAGIGVGVPGLVDLDHGIVVSCANLGWKQVDLQGELQKRFGCPVTVINDVDAGVYGEYRFGSAKGSRSVVGIFPGTGIGGGFIYEGNIIRGKNYSCFEIGHTQVNPQGNLCGCGRIGCLETEASRLAIASSAARAAYRGDAPNLLAAAGTDLNDIRSGALAEAIRAGDKSIEQIVRRAANMLGSAAGDIVNLLSPDTIVLGGGLVEALPTLMLEGVEEGVNQRAMAGYLKTCKITISKLGDDAGVRGAAAWCEHIQELKTSK